MNKELISLLKSRWTILCNDNFVKMGDVGSCVLGAGIMDGNKMILRAFDVSPCQGNMVWETGIDKLISDFNQEFNTKLWFEYGNMD